MNMQDIKNANRALAQLGVDVIEKDAWVCEVTVIGQKPLLITRDQLRAVSAWEKATKQE